MIGQQTPQASPFSAWSIFGRIVRHDGDLGQKVAFLLRKFAGNSRGNADMMYCYR